MSQTVLHIDASVDLDNSVSRAISARTVADLSPDKVIRRDLVTDPLPQIDGTWAQARLVPEDEAGDAERASLALSDALVEELHTADTIVIGMPVYNFGMPASLKAWVDLVARPRKTFRYTDTGPEGLLKNKRAIILAAAGGTEIGGSSDFATTHLAFVLRFLGIEDIEIRNAKEMADAA